MSPLAIGNSSLDRPHTFVGAGIDQLVGIVYNKGPNGSYLCLNGTLDPVAVKGKVVLCDRGGNGRKEKGDVVQSAGGNWNDTCEHA